MAQAKNNSFVKNFLTLFSGNIVAQIIPLLFAPIIARIFAPQDFAIQGNFTALVGVIAIIAAGRYEFAFVLPKSDKKANELLYLSIRILLVISILSLAILFLKGPVTRIYGNKALLPYLPYVTVGIFIVALNSIFIQWLVRHKSFKVISISKIVQSSTLNLVTVFLGWLHFGALGLILGWMAGFVLVIIVLFRPFKKTTDLSLVHKPDVKVVAKEYKDFPTVNSAHAFLDLFFSQFLLFAIITNEFGLLTLGLFFMMNKYLRVPVRLISGSMGQVYYQDANEKLNEGSAVLPVLLRTLKLTLLFAIPVLVIVLFFGPLIFKIYLGNKWLISGEYAQIMIIPVFFNFLVSPLSSTPLIYNKQKTAFLLSILGYGISIVALFAGIWQHWSFERVLMLFAAAMALYYVVLLIWYFILAKYSGKHLDK